MSNFTVSVYRRASFRQVTTQLVVFVRVHLEVLRAWRACVKQLLEAGDESIKRKLLNLEVWPSFKEAIAHVRALAVGLRHKK